ncbi:hypothetical protein [Parerythrobacter aestuarii]|uniref:hypothetical protein n=1 Tax=Parerythrobacter aestuarii TaxID=3020909 RepID=UPI0024DE5288|nr:hypothetical protein [Parerythrobacter aestuarii]
MPNALVDPLARFALRHEKLLSALAIGWFVLTCAAYARFIPVPDIPYVTDRNSWMLSGPWNAIWWGFLRPAILRRKDALSPADSEQS